MKIVSDLTNALTKRDKAAKPTTEPGNDTAVKPKRIGRSARKAKAAAPEKEQVDVDQAPNGRSTRKKAQPAEESKDAHEPVLTEAAEEESKKEGTKGAQNEKRAAKATKTKEAPTKTPAKEIAKDAKTLPVAEAVSTASSEKSSTDGELETAMASLALGDDENMEVEASKSPSSGGRTSRFGRKLLTPKKYKDYLLGAARRNPSST